ncbi:type IV toxin-antitoxin system AbiEi family antitoxin domain-containing protein [Nocardioides sp.]|uniref:type IV toxin-antitoxin system AbiEi family antitoxin domain-containing protein n=1 Tax=Nocardioides sp. TaxID=35761 RepID=UPI00286D0B31|nr:type IV toxin-antitoxin system AbiEi family antitoxin domain-containing protein [Nocardioides sp.]
MDKISELLRDQDGLVSRRQALGLGLKQHDLERMLRRRELATVHPGVYVEHTGPLTWKQRAWAAVLLAGPGSALSHTSAVRIAEGPGRRHVDDRDIEVAVDADRNVTPAQGVHVHRLRDFTDRALTNLAPPRIRYDDAVLDVTLDAPTRLDTVAVLADACGGRRTTAQRLLRTARSRSRVRDRASLLGVLEDVAEGTCSVLEHGYLDRVLRPHGLPEGLRQVRYSHAGRTYTDVDHGGVLVELDGRLFHDSAVARDLDLGRDLSAAVDGLETLRLGYGQVFRDGCATAAAVGAVLQRRGWDGEPTRCADCP